MKKIISMILFIALTSISLIMAKDIEKFLGTYNVYEIGKMGQIPDYIETNEYILEITKSTDSLDILLNVLYDIIFDNIRAEITDDSSFTFYYSRIDTIWGIDDQGDTIWGIITQRGANGKGYITQNGDTLNMNYYYSEKGYFGGPYIAECIGIKVGNISNKKFDGYILYQNVPNPSSESTVIKYSLLENIQNAKICITDILGNSIKTFELQNNDGYIVLDNTDFTSGIYYYTLYLNNQNIETKQMIINK